jgi:hypothetical protein
LQFRSLAAVWRRHCRNIRVVLIAVLAGCSTEHEDYYPLDGARWSYFAIAETILGEARDSRYLVFNSGATTFAGEAVFSRVAQTASLEYLRYQGRGVERLAARRPDQSGIQRDEPYRIILPSDLEVGQRWIVPSTVGLVESRTFARSDRVISRRYPVQIEKTIVAVDAEVSVPAGHFSNCLKISGHGRTSVRTDRGTSQAIVTVDISDVVRSGGRPGQTRAQRNVTQPVPQARPPTMGAARLRRLGRCLVERRAID